MALERFGLARTIGVALCAAAAVSACALVGPPYSPSPPQAGSSARRGSIPHSSAAPQPAAAGGNAAAVAPPAGAVSAPPPAPHYQLGPAAQALVASARAQQQSGNFGLAAETLDRALSIEPRNPLVWLALGRESLAAGNPAQAYGMGRKALYLASGDPSAQASAWGLIAATLRAEGRNQEALAAEQKAAQLSVQ
jgi:tetratricopeptide (TPR) repeat protein